MNFRHIEEVESTDLGDCIFRYIEKEVLCIKYDYVNNESIN